MKILSNWALALLMACMAAATAAVQPVSYVVRYGVDPLALDAVLLVHDEMVTLTGLTPGQTYFVTVAAVRYDGAMSEPSAVVRYEVPAGPMRVTLQESDDNAEWTDVATHHRPRHARKFYRLKIEP